MARLIQLHWGPGYEQKGRLTKLENVGDTHGMLASMTESLLPLEKVQSFKKKTTNIMDFACGATGLWIQDPALASHTDSKSTAPVLQQHSVTLVESPREVSPRLSFLWSPRLIKGIGGRDAKEAQGMAWFTGTRNVNKLVREWRGSRLVRQQSSLMIGLRESLVECRRFAKTEVENIQAHGEEDFEAETASLKLCARASLTELCSEKGDTFSSMRPNNSFFSTSYFGLQ